MARFNPQGNKDFQLESLLNGGLMFGDNIEGGWIEVILEGPPELSETDIVDINAIQTAVEEETELSGILTLATYLLDAANRLSELQFNKSEEEAETEDSPPSFAEQEIRHDLGYTPIGFILVSQDGPGDVWSARQSEWNRSSLWLATNARNLKVRLFVM